MNHNGLDWLNFTGGNGDTNGNGSLPPPPVSFGFSTGATSQTTTEQDLANKHVIGQANGAITSVPPTSTHSGVSNTTPASTDKDSSKTSLQLAQDRFNSVFERLNISSRDQFSQSEDNLTARTSSSNGMNLGEKPMSTSASTDTLIGEDNPTPLSLTTADLTQQEAKTYLRWYNDILTRKGTKTITIDDVFKFLCNFRITDKIKEAIKKIFNKYLHSLNIGQFFAMLRIVAHALQGQLPSRGLIRVTAGVPKPISILSRKRLQDNPEPDNDSEEANDEPQNIFKSLHKPDQKLDLDGFTQFILTGERPSETPKKKNKRNGKRVKFSEQLTIELESENYAPRQVDLPSQDEEGLSNEIDYSLPMDQLLLKLKANNTGGSMPPSNGGQTTNNGYGSLSSAVPKVETPDEEEELKDMQDSINQFHNVNIDSVSIHGTPSNIPSVFFSSPIESPQMGLSPQPTGPEAVPAVAPLAPNLTGSVSKSLRSTLAAPVPERPSLLDYGSSTLQQQQSHLQLPVSNSNHHQTLQVPRPPPRHRSQSSPAEYVPKVSSPLGSASENGTQYFQNTTPGYTNTVTATPTNNNNLINNSSSLRATSPPVPAHAQVPVQFPTPHGAPPPPPPSRIRSTSSPVEPSNSNQLLPPPPPPPRARKNSNSPVPPPVPPLPAHHQDPITFNPSQPSHPIYNNSTYESPNHSGNDLLDGLRALQDEVDRLKSSTGL